MLEKSSVIFSRETKNFAGENSRAKILVGNLKIHYRYNGVCYYTLFDVISIQYMCQTYVRKIKKSDGIFSHLAKWDKIPMGKKSHGKI